MGQEVECRVTLGKKSFAGKAYLETDHILFRGEKRIKIPLKDLKSVKAWAGVLTLHWPKGPAAFELGAAAEKWEKKILHPPTLAEKLGIKAGLTIRVVGEFPPDFLAELSGLPVVPAPAKTKTDLLFFSAPARRALRQVPRLAQSLAPAGALWIVYPKGAAEIREIEVLEAGRAAGLKDVKVASFSATHTALRFVVPLAAR